jgi:hypothetical protein
VSPRDLRQLFNAGPYRTRIAEGRLIPQFLRNAHLDTPDDKGNPPCTYRQTIRYLDGDGNPVVEVFQYLLPDGGLGASGLPDPKRLWIGGEVLVAETETGFGAAM